MSMRESTATSRELGGELRRRRELAGMAGIDLARRTGWQQSKISRMEAGRGDFSDLTVTTYLAHCGVPVAEVAEIVRSVQGTMAYRARPTMLSNVILHEQTARSITMVAPALVPGLLQTEEYARAVMTASRQLGEPEIARRVGIRQERQRLLRRRNPPRFTFLIREQALRTPLGGAQVMHEQMLHLVFAGDREHITIRVVPMTSDVAAVSGEFRLMEFADHDPVVYVEGGLASIVIEGKDEIAEARRTAREVASDALDDAPSREFLARLASEYA